MINQSCIITGGSGFIGTHLVNYLIEQNIFNKIIILDLISPHIVHPKIEYIQCDIRKPICIDIDAKPVILYHLAALCKEPGYLWDDYFETNFIGTKNVCKFAKDFGIMNIIYTSTMMVYKAGEKQMKEDSLTAPDTGYGISKLLGELELQSWAAENEQNRLRIARIGVVFGKGEKGNFTRLYYALKKRRFFYIGKKSTIKSSIYVKDVIRFIQFLRDDDRTNIIYNMTYPETHSIKNICETFFKVFEFKYYIPVIPYSLALIVSYLFEIVSEIGLYKSSIHHRRIQKLYYSTNISSQELINTGFKIVDVSYLRYNYGGDKEIIGPISSVLNLCYIINPTWCPMQMIICRKV